MCGDTRQHTQVIPLDDPQYPYICHQCLLTGYINYCPRCWMVKRNDELGLDGKCKEDCTRETGA